MGHENNEAFQALRNILDEVFERLKKAKPDLWKYFYLTSSELILLYIIAHFQFWKEFKEKCMQVFVVSN